MQDYQDEIKDFFAVDKQLASELEYDMKKYNEQLAQEQELAKQASENRMTEGGDGAQAMQVGRWPTIQAALCVVFPTFLKIHV